MVWVRISELPVEYFNTSFFMRLGAKISHSIKVDTTTIQVSRDKYAQICVEMNLAKLLLAKFRLQIRIRWLEYEGLHMAYFHCGYYGHRLDEYGNTTRGATG